MTGDWEIAFSDEFNSSALDTSIWTACYWWNDDGCTISSNNELEWYQPENVRLQDGVLVLEAQKREIEASDGKTYQYTSGMVTTGRATSDLTQPPGFAFQYGFAEIRARVPTGTGLWPAFWMLPLTHESRPEIDIVEILGNNPRNIEMNFHYVEMDGEKTKIGGEWVGPDFSQDWHIFGVHWEPGQITWYVDGVERYRFAETAYVPAEPMYLILNLAVGGDWPGSPNAKTVFPSTYEIDYVRVFERPNLVHLAPIADTYVDSSSQSENFGESDTIYSDDDPVKLALLRFDATTLAGRRLSSAYLRIHTTEHDGSPSESRHSVLVSELSDWAEDSVNYTNFSLPATELIGVIENVTWVNTVYEIQLDVTRLERLLGTVFTLHISSDGSDGLYLFTRESLRGGCQLILTLIEE